jgi:antagonist of KipI
MITTFLIERPGVNSTFQDKGRFGLQHLGVVACGSMDSFLSELANKLVGNNSDQPLIEFAYQGPLIKLISGKAHISITGNIKFEIRKKNNKIINGTPNTSFNLEEGDTLDVIATTKSIYGYLAVEGNFDLKKINNSFSTLLKAKIGPNKGEKLIINQKINVNSTIINNNKKISLDFGKESAIRVLPGKQVSYFSDNSLKDFYSQKYKITNNTDRMGARLEGDKLNHIGSFNIPSEGISKGSIQVPGDGQPIVLLNDHPTIGGYPKIAHIISADYDNFVQKQPGSEIIFKAVNINEAEKAFVEYLEYKKKKFSSFN